MTRKISPSFGGVAMSVRGSMVFLLIFAVYACGSGRPTSPSGGSPRTVYVSTTGNDGNSGGISAPWLTLRYAVAQLHPGDTLYLRGGSLYRNSEYDRHGAGQRAQRDVVVGGDHDRGLWIRGCDAAATQRTASDSA